MGYMKKQLGRDYMVVKQFHDTNNFKLLTAIQQRN